MPSRVYPSGCRTYDRSWMVLLSVRYREPIRASISGSLSALNLPKSRCRQGFSLLSEPQNDFFLTPTFANVVRSGKLVPDISTEVASRHVYRLPPVQSQLHGPPAGCSVRTASQSPGGIVILIVRTFSIA